jgi:hypothetical protein
LIFDAFLDRPRERAIAGDRGLRWPESSHSGTKAHPPNYCAMQWIEALINISALAGFVGVANAWPVDDRTRR